MRAVDLAVIFTASVEASAIYATAFLSVGRSSRILSLEVSFSKRERSLSSHKSNVRATQVVAKEGLKFAALASHALLRYPSAFLSMGSLSDPASSKANSDFLDSLDREESIFGALFQIAISSSLNGNRRFREVGK